MPPPRAVARRRSLRPLALLVALVVGAGGLGGLAPATPAAAAAVATADGGVVATTLVPAANAFPTGTAAQRQVSRDCGHSVEVPGNRALWLFCDTAVYDNVSRSGAARTANLGFVPSGTAGLAPLVTDPTPSSPVRLTEAAYPALPTPFIVGSSRYGAARTAISCPGGRAAFAWTKSLVALPGTSTVLAVYQDHCPDLGSGFAPYDVGVGELTLPDVAAGDVSGGNRVAVTRQTDSVQVNPTPGVANEHVFSMGGVIDGDHLYLYGVRPVKTDCTTGTCRVVADGAVEVARVTWADGGYRSAANYRYYTGTGANPWSTNPSAAANVLPDADTPAGDGMSVRWQPEVGLYVMAHADSPFGTMTGAGLRTSPTPWGPWSAATTVTPNASSARGYPTRACAAPVRCRTYMLHPELSGRGALWFSYVREGDLADAAGSPVTISGDSGQVVRLASVPFTALPRPPAAGAVTPRAPASVTAVAGDGRATVSWAAPPPVAGATVLGYRVTPSLGATALDPVAFSATATSGVVRGLDNTRAYTFTVTAVTAAGTGPASAPSAAVTPRGAPRAPTSVTASPGDGEVSLSWTAPANTGGAAVTGYRVTPYRDGVAQTARVLTQTATSKVIGSLANGARYTFTVQAVTSLGTSGDSAPSAATVPFGVPTAPTAVVGTPRDGAVSLAWSAPASANGSPVTGYRVTPYVGATAQAARVLAGPATSTVVSGLANGTAHTFRVEAVNARGVGAASTASAAVTPRTLAGPPTGLTATAGDGRVTLSWVAPTATGGSPITGYQVTPTVGGVFGATTTLSSTATSTVVTGLPNGTVHRFVVRAVTAAGVGASSDFSPAVTPRTTPGAPTGLTVTPGNGQVTLSWVAPTATGGAPVTGYRVTPSVGTAAQPARDVSYGTTHIVGGLANGTAYTFVVQAVNAAGAGPGARSGVGTPRTVPGAPTVGAAAAGDRAATVSWRAPTSDGGAPVTGYQVTPWVDGVAGPPRTFTSTATTQAVTGLANGTSYRFSVRAVNPAGLGPSSGFSGVATPATPATTPRGPAPYASWGAMVDGLFRAVLGRGPSAAERGTWSSRLSGGSHTPGQMVVALRGMGDQATVVDPVARLYRAYFLRAPDAGGLAHWVGQRRAGRSLGWVSQRFAASQEFTAMYGSLSDGAFMDLVYAQVLERAPDANGRAFWVAELRSGRRTRGEVMIGFSEAAEYKGRYGAAVDVAVGHLLLLGRAPSTREAEAWTSRAAAGVAPATLYGELVAGTEFAARHG